MYSGIIQRYSECTVSIEYTLFRADAVYLVDRVNKARIQRVFEKLYESLAAGLMCVLWLQFHLNSQEKHNSQSYENMLRHIYSMPVSLEDENLDATSIFQRIASF